MRPSPTTYAPVLPGILCGERKPNSTAVCEYPANHLVNILLNGYADHHFGRTIKGYWKKWPATPQPNKGDE